MKQLAAGQLNRKVVFQSSTDSADGYDLETWADDFSKWVKIETGIAKEAEQSGQIMGEVTHTIKTHYSQNITANHRVKHKTTTYEIVGKPINVDFANKVTLILVNELTDA